MTDLQDKFRSVDMLPHRAEIIASNAGWRRIFQTSGETDYIYDLDADLSVSDAVPDDSIIIFGIDNKVRQYSIP